MNGDIIPGEESRTLPALADADLNAGEAQLDPEADLTRVLTELGEDSSGSKVQVSRIVEGQRQGEFCDEYLPSEFSLKRLADDFGGGAYRVLVYVPRYEDRGGSRLKVGVMLAKNQRIVITGAPKVPKRMEKPDPQAVNVPAPVPVDAAQIVRDAVAQTVAQIRDLIPKPPTLAEQLEQIKLMREAFTPPPAPREEPRDTLGEFLKFLTVQEKLRERLPQPESNSGDSAGLFGVAREVFSFIKQAQTNQQPAIVNDPASLPAAADELQPRPAAPAAEPVSQESEEDRSVRIMYVGYVSRLVAKARRHDDVKPVAEEIYDSLPDEALAWILNDPAYLTVLAEYNKDAPLFKVWFDNLREELRRIHAEEKKGPQA